MPITLESQLVDIQALDAMGGERVATPRFADNIYESVGMSLYNAVKGDPDASIRAILRPNSLSPRQHRTLVDEWTGGSDGPVSAVLRTITNPLFLIGAALSFKWPVMNPERMAALGKSMVRYERWIPGPLRGLLGLNEVFHGTPIPRLFSRIGSASKSFAEDVFVVPMNRAISEWRAITGRIETPADQARWALLADGAGADRIRQINGMISAASRARVENGGAPIRKLAENALAIAPQVGDDVVVRAWQGAGARTRELFTAQGKIDKGFTAGINEFMRKTKGVDAPIAWVEGQYYPHIAKLDPRRIQAMYDETWGKLLSGGDIAPDRMAAMKAARRRVGKSSDRLIERTGFLTPDAEDLAAAGASKETVESLRALQEFHGAQGRPAAYSLRFSSVVDNYANSVSRAWGWNAGGHGRALAKEVQAVHAAERSAGWTVGPKTELLRNTWLPQALGQSTFEQSMKAMEWAGVRQHAYRALQSPAMERVPGPITGFLKRLVDNDANWTPGAAGSKIANYFYLSTLGGNLGSAFQNLLQPILTTAPVIGVVPTLRGIAAVAKKIPEAMKLAGEGLSSREVLTRLFPEFAAAGGDFGLLADDILGESARIGRGATLSGKGLHTVDRARDVLMAPFRNTELFNRLATFEGGRLKAISHMDSARAADYAMEVMGVTQLWSGMEASPTLTRNWPGWARQFTSFPLKMAGFLAGSAANLGGALNPGTLGRAMAFSTAAYEGVRGLTGGDISRSLLFGAVPVPESTGPFAPLPVVPPAIGLVGSVAMDVFGHGDWDNTRKVAPLLVPGGLMGARVAQLVSPEISRAIGRSYSDYAGETPEGAVPQYNADGQLIGYESAWGLMAGMLGVPGRALSGSGAMEEGELFRYTLSQRDRIRDIRRRYMEAWADNDHTTANNLNAQFLREYGHPIQVRPQDWEAVRSRRLVPRIAGVLRTLPEDVRPQFQSLVNTAFAGAGESFIGVDPELFGLPRGELLNRIQGMRGAEFAPPPP